MIDRDKVNRDMMDSMWAFLRLGGQKASVQTLRENCEILKQMMEQKTAGQRADHPHDVPFADLDAVKNIIVLESLALYVSGALDKLEESGVV